MENCKLKKEYNGENAYCEAILEDFMSSTFCEDNKMCPYKLQKIILDYDADLRKANSKLDAIKEILTHTAWINIGNAPKKSIELIHNILGE